MFKIHNSPAQTLLLLALLAGGCSSAQEQTLDEPQTADVKAELLETYTEASKWCQKLDECEVDMPCADLPSEKRVERVLSKFDDEDLEGCMDAVRYYEQCALPLSCGKFIASYDTTLCKSGAGPWERCCFEKGSMEPVECEDSAPKCLQELQAASRLCEEIENAIYDLSGT